MIKNIFKLSNLVLVLTVFVLFSCDNGNKNSNPAPNPNPSSTNPATQKCTITEWNTTSQYSTIPSKTIFEYDARKSLTKISNNPDASGQSSFYGLIEHNTVGQISKCTYFQQGSYSTFILFTYNSNGQVAKVEAFRNESSGTKASYIRTYDYNSNKKLIKISTFDGNNPALLTSYIDLTYPTNNSATAQEFSDWDNTGSLDFVDKYEFSFDDKMNPQPLLGLIWYNPLYSSYPFENNIASVTRTSMTSSGPAPYTFTYTYNYNSDSFPTSVTQSNGSTILNSINYSYNCN